MVAVEAAVEAAVDPPAYDDIVPDNYEIVQSILNETGPDAAVQVLLILLIVLILLISL